MADAMLKSTDKTAKKSSTEGRKTSSKKGDKKLPEESVHDRTEKGTSAACSPNILSNVSVAGTSTATGETSRNVPSKEPSLGDIFTLLTTIQKEQNVQKTEMSSMQNMVHELYYDTADNYETENYQEVHEIHDPDDNNNVDKTNDFVDSSVEPPTKRQKTSQQSELNTVCNDSVTVNMPSVFKSVAEDFKTKDVVDGKVNEDLAEIVNGFFRQGISDEKYQELMKSIARPENCISLTKTRVNQLVWDQLWPQTRSFDSVIQQHQETVIKASCNVTKMLDKLSKIKIHENEQNSKDMQSVIDMGLEALGLLAQYNKLTNLKRKEYQKFDLSADYHHLCSPSVPFTELLYGDDVHQKSKEIQDMNRLGRQLNGNRGRGSGRGGGIPRGRGSYRGRGFRGRGQRGGRGRGQNIAMLSNSNQNGSNAAGSKNFRNFPSFQRK